MRDDSAASMVGGPHPLSGRTWCLTMTKYVDEVREAVNRFPVNDAKRVVGTIMETLAEQRTIWVAGNGGSATSAAHLSHDCAVAARPVFAGPVPFVGLADNIARITAIANDLGYAEVFAEQLRQGGRSGDLLLAISVSGRSPNVLRAAETARGMGMGVASLLGQRGELSSCSDFILDLDVADDGVAEDLHLMFNHMLVRALRRENPAMARDEERRSGGWNGAMHVDTL